MKQVKNEMVKARRITKKDANYFFGYYDVPAWSENQKYHLCHRVSFWDRLPNENDVAEIGMINMDSGEYIYLESTTAWNFQQGSMLQWNPKAPNDEIIFNVRKNGEYRGVIMDVHTLKKRELELPVANVDPKGRYALSINFDRMFDFRPGYGYAGRVDKYIDDNHPANDGIFLIDLQTGKSKLIISLEQLWELTKHYLAEDKKVLVNHITFNTDGSRFVFLLRYFPEKGKMWETSIITANTDGSDIYCLSRYFFASHYHWKSPNELLIYAYGEEGNQLYELKDKSNHAKVVDVSFFLRDGHCSYSPDRSKILYDSYPDEQGYRNLYIYDVMKKKGITLASYFAYPDIETDIRCDLHPRWNPSGTEITFDSVHEGQRGIYHIKLNHINL